MYLSSVRESENGRLRPALLRVGKALGITGLAFLLSFIMSQPFSFSASTLISGHDRRDFTMVDFYNIVADSRLVSRLDRDILIVNIDNADRYDIACLLDVLSGASPRAVGLDVEFPRPSDDGGLLLHAVRNCPNLVAISSLTYSPEGYGVASRSFFADSVPGLAVGASNLVSAFDGATVREFPVTFDMADGSRMPSFVRMLAHVADPEAEKRLLARGTFQETIDFPSREFDVVEPADLMQDPAMADGRIVLVGAMTERGDTHRTPVVENMSGVEIHAHSLSTVLSGDYYTRFPEIWVSVLTFLTCFLLALLSISMKPGYKGLVLRVLQIASLLICLRVGYGYFIDDRLIINFSRTLLMLTFVLFACDVWIGTAWCLSNLPGRFRAMWRRLAGGGRSVDTGNA